MSPEAVNVVCPHCDSVNRIPVGKPAGRAKCGVCHKPLFTGHPVTVDAVRFDKHVGRSGIPVVVDFWAEWCGPCRAMAPFFERVAGEMEPAVRFLKLDTDQAPELSARYGIRGIPTTIVFKGGKESARRVGAMDATTLRSWVGAAAAA